MSSNSYCDPCSEEAIKFCLDCEECLCEDWVDHHKVFRATRRHRLMSLPSISRSEKPSEEDFCEVHQDVPLDLYCMQHDEVCCRMCIHSNHQSCKEVLPLEAASKHIHKSSLFGDTLLECQNIGTTLENLRKARDENINELDSVENAILADISKWKNQLITKIRTSEKKN
ncbi:unnamed protein product [Mytilus coruscus]|uniref:B box-type domain-containing protein n=1 Tax=Mytilus coruscus TaxID=42192 RepID=A0A6J8C4I0_MYTCO|nr:unnamed protein product [Mytilus coruscus]